MRKLKIKDSIFLFLAIWVYYSLNARNLNWPIFTLLRWVFPILLAGCTIMVKRGKIPSPPSIVIFLTISIMPAIMFSANVTTSLAKFISLVLVILCCYIYLYNVPTVEDMEQKLDILFYIIVIYQILNFVCVVAGVGVVSGRHTGITTNANTLGVYSNLAFWASAALGIKNKNKIFMQAILLSTVVTSIASGSRTAFIVLLFNIMCLWILRYRKSKFFYLVLIVLIVGTYLLLSGQLEFLNITALERLAEEGGTSRGVMWDFGLEIWRRSPYFGCGYMISSTFNVLGDYMAFHNSYISFLAETGLWGCVVLGIGFVAILIPIAKKFTRDMKKKNITVFMIAVLVVINLLLAGWSESFLFAVGSTEGFTFWFLISWLLGCMNRQKIENKER